MLNGLLKSFFVALRGLGEALMQERNFRLQWLMGLMASLLIYLLPFELWARMLLLSIIFIILSLELFNSSIENICDSNGKEHNELKRKAKDFTAGGVLLLALLSLLVFFNIAALMPQSAFMILFLDPMMLTSWVLIFIGNAPLCLLSILSPYALMLLVPNITLHALFIIVSKGDPLFLGLSIIFHLGIITSSITRALAKK